MVFETGWIVIGILVLIFIIVIAYYLVYDKQITARRRLSLIRTYKKNLQKESGAPVLIHGTAGLKPVVMPASGESAAFHATFIMSRGCQFFMGPGQGKPLPEKSSFRVFLTSRDFTVTEAGVPYTVSISSALERMNMGAEYFTQKNRKHALDDGLQESVFDTMVQFIAGTQALGPIFDITERGRSFASSVDTRVRTFTQDHELPPAIAGVLTEKNIRPQAGEEITVIEVFIPLKKEIWVFGEFDGKDAVTYGGTGLSVSYTDPDPEGM